MTFDGDVDGNGDGDEVGNFVQTLFPGSVISISNEKVISGPLVIRN